MPIEEEPPPLFKARNLARAFGSRLGLNGPSSNAILEIADCVVDHLIHQRASQQAAALHAADEVRHYRCVGLDF